MWMNGNARWLEAGFPINEVQPFGYPDRKFSKCTLINIAVEPFQIDEEMGCFYQFFLFKIEPVNGFIPL
jgi:hypothetical protein